MNAPNKTSTESPHVLCVTYEKAVDTALATQVLPEVLYVRDFKSILEGAVGHTVHRSTARAHMRRVAKRNPKFVLVKDRTRRMALRIADGSAANKKRSGRRPHVDLATPAKELLRKHPEDVITFGQVRDSLGLSKFYKTAESYEVCLRRTMNSVVAELGWDRCPHPSHARGVAWRRVKTSETPVVKKPVVSFFPDAALMAKAKRAPLKLEQPVVIANAIGGFVQDHLNDNFMSEEKIAEHCGLTLAEFKAVLSQKAPLTAEVADKLTQVPGLHKRFDSRADLFGGRTLLMKDAEMRWANYAGDANNG